MNASACAMWTKVATVSTCRCIRNSHRAEEPASSISCPRKLEAHPSSSTYGDEGSSGTFARPVQED